jgi:hypothetical protein
MENQAMNNKQQTLDLANLIVKEFTGEFGTFELPRDRGFSQTKTIGRITIKDGLVNVVFSMDKQLGKPYRLITLVESGTVHSNGIRPRRLVAKDFDSGTKRICEAAELFAEAERQRKAQQLASENEAVRNKEAHTRLLNEFNEVCKHKVNMETAFPYGGFMVKEVEEYYTDSSIKFRLLSNGEFRFMVASRSKTINGVAEAAKFVEQLTKLL